MLKKQRATPTINFTGNDPDCDLDYIPNKSRRLKLNYILKMNFGFGGYNSCLILKNA